MTLEVRHTAPLPDVGAGAGVLLSLPTGHRVRFGLGREDDNGNNIRRADEILEVTHQERWGFEPIPDMPWIA